MARRKPWGDVKRDAANSVFVERDVGYLDPGIAPILESLNSVPLLATTSSCIGRIALVEGERHWGRDEDARIVYKTHGTLRVEDLYRVAGRGFRDLWLKATGPILHVRTPSLECALHLLSHARRAGFKHSGIISMGSPGGIVVELTAAPQLYAPLIVGGRRLYRLDHSSLEALVETANRTVEEGRRRLYHLAESDSRDPGACAASSTR